MLTIDDGLKRILGFLDDDPLLDESTVERMKLSLTAAEHYIKGAVGEDDPSFYEKEGVKELYHIAVNATAANYFDHPTSAAPSSVADSIIGQLRGRYDIEQEANNGSASERGQT